MTLISNPTPEINVRSEYITDGRILDLSAASKRRTEKARKRERERERSDRYTLLQEESTCSPLLNTARAESSGHLSTIV